MRFKTKLLPIMEQFVMTLSDDHVLFAEPLTTAGRYPARHRRLLEIHVLEDVAHHLIVQFPLKPTTRIREPPGTGEAEAPRSE